MRILDKYILRSYLVPVTCCFTAFTLIFVITDLFERLRKFMKADTDVVMVLKYYVSIVLVAFEYLIPASLLLGTLYTLWQMARKNELTAMRASGISLYRIMLPLLAVGLLATLATAVIKEFIAPQATIWAEEFTRSYRVPEQNLRHNVAYYNRATRRLWLVEQFDLHNSRILKKVKITQERESGARARDIRASKAEYMDGVWWLHDAILLTYDEKDNPIGAPVPYSQGVDGLTEMPDFTETPEDFVIELRDWRHLSTREMLRYMEAHPTLSDRTLAKKRYDIHARLALPWACLIVTLFGIPAGAGGGRQSALTGVVIAVAFFFGFYALNQVGLFLGKRAVVSPWIGAWLSNIVFMATGTGMLVRMR